MNTKWTEVTAELAEAKKKYEREHEQVQSLQNDLQQVNKLVNGGQGAVNYNNALNQYLEGYNIKLQDMLNEEYIALGPELDLIKSQEVKDVWKYLQGFKDKSDRYTNLIDYQQDCLKQLQACLHIIPGLWIKLIRSEEEKEQIRRQIEDNRKGMQDQIDTLTAQKNHIDDERIEKSRQLENEKRVHQDDKDAKDKEITAVKREYEIKLTKQSRQIDTLEGKIKDLTKRERRTFQETAQPDGEVTFADAKLGYAWIDLGKNQGLRRGTRFQVFESGKGGRQRVKALVEVKKVEQDMSQVAVIPDYEYFDDSLKEKFILPTEADPVVKGDLIRSIWIKDNGYVAGSPVYDKDAHPKFFFLGKNVGNRFYTKTELGKKIEEFGGKVVPELTAEVDYVVILPKGEDDDAKNYDKAVLFGTTFLKEDELIDFVGK
jgi:myosin heavy subunit